jgi:hypothetical protein
MCRSFSFFAGKTSFFRAFQSKNGRVTCREKRRRVVKKLATRVFLQPLSLSKKGLIAGGMN